MYKLAALFIVGVALNLGWQDQDAPVVNPEMERQEIVNLETEAARAIQTNTGTFFRRVYSDDFSGTLSHGQPVNKTTFINSVQTSEVRYDAFNASDISVRFYRDAAVASCLWSARGTYKEQRFTSQMRVIHIYINTPRGWRGVAGQITLPPPAAQQPL